MKNALRFIICLLLFHANHTIQAATSPPADNFVEMQGSECASELAQHAKLVFKQNPQRMLAYNNKTADLHLFNALAVNSYRDRDSHVSFHSIKNSDGSCEISITESYILQTTCNDARNEVFSKWNLQGKLNARTLVLESRHIKGKQAFLTAQFSTLCLVTTRQVIHNSIH